VLHTSCFVGSTRRREQLILVSIWEMRDELDEAELKAELWVSHLVCKPFSPRELLKTVQETLAAIEAVSTEHSA
jgi:hypothetical protein